MMRHCVPPPLIQHLGFLIIVGYSKANTEREPALGSVEIPFPLPFDSDFSYKHNFMTSHQSLELGTNEFLPF